MVYDRDYGDQVLTFEASGALMHACLVMRDRETDSWWSMMMESAIGGELDGRPLYNLPVGEKTLWEDWKGRYPETIVLSVEGTEHDPRDPYEGYFKSDQGFRGLEAPDDRLPTKEPIFTFKINGVPHAVPYARIEGGAAFRVGNNDLFLFREDDAPLFSSTLAYIALADSSGQRTPGKNRFQKDGGVWRDTASGSLFSPEKGFPPHDQEHVAIPERLPGLDTFWYIWSSTYEEGVLLE